MHICAERHGGHIQCHIQTVMINMKSHGHGMYLTYKGVSKSPRTMLITRKSLVVHEFPARVCCGGVL